MNPQFWLGCLGAAILLFVAYALCVAGACASSIDPDDDEPIELTMHVEDKKLLDWDQLEDLRQNGSTVIQVNGYDVVVTADDYIKIGGTL